jgi:hypothetical protein
MNKCQLETENERLRNRLEVAYDMIGDALGFDDSGEEQDESDDDEE